MDQHKTLRLIAPTAAMALVLTAAPAADARTQPVLGWIKRTAIPLKTIDPAAPLGDLAPLRRAVGGAAVTGLGESAHGTAEELTLKHRALRFLVERMGYRSVAWEEDWTMGVRLNAYLRTGKGDLDALMAEMSPQWQSRKVADVLRWLRGYNAGRKDKVQFVGVEYYFTRALAYDAIAAYVARTAPHRLPALRRHLRPIRPRTDNIREHVTRYQKVRNKRPFIRHAQQVHALVRSLPHRPGDRAHSLALHHARQIVSFYVHYSLKGNDSNVYRDARAAENLKWWRDRSHDKVVYWAASPHTAVAPRLRLATPHQPDIRFASVGSFLRRWYGGRYRSISFTLDHGTVSTGPGQTLTLPPPAQDWFERPFGKVGASQFILDLRTPAPQPVREWLNAPAKTRGVSGPGSHMEGGSVGQWFDIIIHRQHVSPG